MMNFIRSLSITIGAFFLEIIPTLYSLFHGLAAEPTLFNTEEIRTLTNNIYVLVSVVMLFAFATRAIAAIVNPDNLWDSKKGVTGVIKRSLIALVLIIAIPFGFEYFYIFQTKIINNYLIEKLILGIDVTNIKLSEAEQKELEKQIEDEDNELTEDILRYRYIHSVSSYKIGQNLAQNVLAATLYPNPAFGDKCKSTVGTKTNVTGIATLGMLGPPVVLTYSGSLCSSYNKAISTNIAYITFIIPQINDTIGFNSTTTNLLLDAVDNAASTIDNALDTSISDYTKSSDELTGYVLNFDYGGLLLVISAGAVVYLLIIFCIDSAVRLIKMAFLEITAPISIMAYIFGGSDVLKKWFKELYTTAISFFLRVAAISFIALVLTHLNDFANSLPDFYGRISKIFIIIGTLIFAKKVPEVIERILGIKINLQGGIGGRLGQMAGVGKVAQNAWKSLGKTAKGIGTTALGVGIGALGAGAKYGVNKLDNSKFNGELLDKIKSNKAYQGVTTAGKVLKTGISQGGGLGKTVKAMNDEFNKSPIAGELHNRSAEEKRLAQRAAAEERLRRLSLESDGTAMREPIPIDPNNPNHKLVNSNKTRVYGGQQVLQQERDPNDPKNMITVPRTRRIMASDINRNTSESEIQRTNYRGLGNAIVEEGRAGREKKVFDEIKSAFDKEKSTTDAIQSRASSVGNMGLANDINSLHSLFTNKRYDDYLNKVNQLYSKGNITADEANTLRATVRRMEGNLLDARAMSVDPNYKISGNIDIMDILNSGSLNGIMINKAATAADKLFNDAKAIVDNGLKGTENNTYLQGLVSQQRDALSTINAQNIEDNKHRMENSDTRYRAPSGPTGPAPMTGFSYDGQSAPTQGPGPMPGFNYNGQPTGPTPTQGQGSNTGGNNQNTQVNGGTIRVDKIEAANVSANNVTGNTFTTNTINGNLNTNSEDENHASGEAKRMDESQTTTTNDTQKIVDAINDVKEATKNADSNNTEVLGEMKEQDDRHYKREETILNDIKNNNDNDNK